MNPYEILDLPKDASIEDIKLRFKQLANIHHPDKGGDAEKFKTINTAYGILIDPIKRQSFDENGISYVDASVIRDSKLKITELFNIHINPHNPENQDLILIMRIELDKQEIHIKEKIKLITKSIEKLNKVKQKCKIKKQSENFMEELIDSAIKNCQVDLKKYEHDEKVCSYTKLVLNNYHYSDLDYFEILSN